MTHMQQSTWTAPEALSLSALARIYDASTAEIALADLIVLEADDVECDDEEKGEDPLEKIRSGLDYLPLRILGFSDGHYHYQSREDGEIISLAPSRHTKLELVSLVPLSFWEIGWGDDDEGIDWVAAADSLMRAGKGKRFDRANIKSRGAWILDGGRLVYHIGNKVIDGAGQEATVTDCDWSSRYTFVRRGDLPMPAITNPLTAAEARPILDFVDALDFETSGQGRLLAGWLVQAVLGGALDWRSHLWLVGGSGSGKTTAVKLLIDPVVRAGYGLKCSGTEAGIRQQLAGDALPVIMDETDPDQDKERKRISDLLTSFRLASSGDRKVKGSPSGTAMSFEMRSALLLIGVNADLEARADKRRVTLLRLKPSHSRTETGRAAFAQSRDALQTLLEQPDTVQRLMGRLIVLWPTFLALLREARNQLLDKGLDEGLADQLGGLVAGAAVLAAETVEDGISEVATLIDTLTRERFISGVQEDVSSDEERLFQAMLDAPIRLDGGLERPAGWVLGHVIDGHGHDPHTATDLADALGRFGIGVDGGWVTIWVTPALREGISKASSAGSWKQPGRLLSDLPTAVAVGVKYNPFTHCSYRAITVKLHAVLQMMAGEPVRDPSQDAEPVEVENFEETLRTLPAGPTSR